MPSASVSSFAWPYDFQLATEDALVGLPEGTIGQMPGSGGNVRIVRLIGMTRTKDIVLLGKRLPAPEAMDVGLITKVVVDASALQGLFKD